MTAAHDQDLDPDKADRFPGVLALSRMKAMLAVLLGLALAIPAALLTAMNIVAVTLLAFALAWAVMVDIDRYRLPDLLTLPMIAGGIAHAALVTPTRLTDCIIGAAAGYLALVLVAEAYRRLRGIDGLGHGDAKLLGAAGAWLGWAPLPSVIFLGAGAGLLFAAGRMLMGRQQLTEAIAFGPFIAAGFWAILLAGGQPLLFP
jgi:leader peptidase (prepilin peptidase)/N-methyltransferase